MNFISVSLTSHLKNNVFYNLFPPTYVLMPLIDENLLNAAHLHLGYGFNVYILDLCKFMIA